ncbi:MAG: hypothetical protein GXO66_10605 [Euryarchaeota archaeon]|nr:hypothetical protein [Euryarchaeota archaeon]
MRLYAVLLILLVLAGCVEKEEAVVEAVGEAVEAPVATPQPEPAPAGDAGGGVRVADILDNPEAYEGMEVVLRGTALPGLAFEFVDEQPYLLNDGTGEIWVITRGTMPMQGSEVVVRGRVVVPYQIKGRHYEVAIIEIEREGGW